MKIFPVGKNILVKKEVISSYIVTPDNARPESFRWLVVEIGDKVKRRSLRNKHVLVPIDPRQLQGDHTIVPEDAVLAIVTYEENTDGLSTAQEEPSGSVQE